MSRTTVENIPTLGTSSVYVTVRFEAVKASRAYLVVDVVNAPISVLDPVDIFNDIRTNYLVQQNLANYGTDSITKEEPVQEGSSGTIPVRKLANNVYY